MSSLHNGYPDPTVEALSAQPLGACIWLQRARFAAEMMFGGEALALIAHHDGGDASIAGYVDSADCVRIEPPKHLEHFSGNNHRIRLPDSGSAKIISLDDLQAERFDGKSSALILAWPLGVSVSFSLMVIAAEESMLRRAAVDDHRGFLTVASNLLRRADKRALIDAGAWIEAEIEKLADLQNLLKPIDLENVEGAEFAVHSRPHAYAGGDYYDITRIRRADGSASERFGIAVADVSGHGPSAVVETAMIDSILRTFPEFAAREQRWGPGNVLNYLNRYMFTRQPRPSFVTMFVAEWSTEASQLNYALAGHPPPILKSPARGSCEAIPAGDGIPLQVLRDYHWQTYHLELLPGDLLVSYTDGVTEAVSPDGIQFGEKRLLELVSTGANDPEALLAVINEALMMHAGGQSFHDDQTIMIAKFL